MEVVERCLPSDQVLLKETKKFLAYQELYSWQENMALYECDADYLKVSLAFFNKDFSVRMVDGVLKSDKCCY